jgi:hypothetical protein
MLKKGSAPMTAHESDPEAIIQRSGMDRDEAKDVQRETVDGASEFLRSWILSKRSRYLWQVGKARKDDF